MKEFVHLHLHSQYSLLDGAIRFEELFPLARTFGMKSLALTDHGNMFGAIEFYQGAINHGIKPLIGCEIYVAPESRLKKEPGKFKDASYHLVILVKNQEGYGNLIRLISLAHLEGFYYKPRVDKELLEKYNTGLIVLSSCLKGEIPALLLNEKKDEAKAVAGWYKEIFDQGRFYLEVQDNGLEEQKTVNQGLVELSRELGLPLVATNDCHYLRREDAAAQDVLLCIQTGKTLKDPKRMKFSTDQFYLRPAEEMERLFGQYPEALQNTLKIAEQCNLELRFEEYHLPRFKPPIGESLDHYLEKSAQEGLEQRFAHTSNVAGERGERYVKRLDEELSMIKSMGFSGYFLIVADFVNYAKTRGIPVGPGRGSAAGSLVAYSLGITDIDPLAYDLIFERFLNPERISLPDIDVDFCIEGRDEVIRYVTEKYGTENVAQIITFGKMQAKAVVRDVGRVLDLPYKEVDVIAKLIPNTLNITLDQALEQEPRLKELAARDETVSNLLSLARSLEGMVRHASTHAAGVVISHRPLMEYIPLYRGGNGEVVTQYAMKDVERVGLVKFDFLGLKTLTVLRKAVELIERTKGDQIELTRIPLDDKETYKLLGSGDTTGIFQLESSGMRDLLMKLRPETFADLIALVALYRPGPLGSGMVDDFIKRRHKKSAVRYDVPKVKEILEDTYGVIVYQEQVMRIASTLGNFTLGDADILRRAMSKKDPAEMERLKEKFIEGARRNGIEKVKSERLFEMMTKFAEYGFNKSHSTAYALIAYQTAYLKVHYPLEFMAALLTCDMDNTDKVMRFVAECREKAIEVLPPDINESDWGFTVSEGRIRYGLGAVKNVGLGAVEEVMRLREGGEQISSLVGFCESVDLRKVNRRVIESFIKAGAFDSVGARRSQLMLVLDEALEQGQARQRERRGGQSALFDGLQSPHGLTPLPDIEEWSEHQLLSFEKEVLGFFLTSHPLIRYQEDIRELTTADTETLAEMVNGTQVSIGGLVAEVKEISTKKGDQMAFLSLEDMKGRVEVIIFPDLFRTVRPYLKVDVPVLIRGVLDKGEERHKVKASSLVPLDEAKKEKVSKVHFRLRTPGLSKDQLLRLKEILEENKGGCEALLHLIVPHQSEVIMALSPALAVEPSEQMRRSVEGLFGEKTVEME
ncbi:MAG: DNA polymerase III subunit alpha [Deltaproteobacteria bacterium RBG_13_52_11]|nr:MAG: DNA polymerase III subunit alpha [Deltaproteobacteria bacterium RBG_13_52_11]